MISNAYKQVGSDWLVLGTKPGFSQSQSSESKQGISADFDNSAALNQIKLAHVFKSVYSACAVAKMICFLELFKKSFEDYLSYNKFAVNSPSLSYIDSYTTVLVNKHSTGSIVYTR